MRFTILREAFLKPLRAVAGVVERRQVQTSPILSNVLITILDETHFSLTATDQEVELIAQGEFEEPATPGAITVPFRKLMDVCRALPEGIPLTLVAEQERAIIRAGRSRFTLSLLPAAEFPNIELSAEEFQFSIPKRTFNALVESTGFAMAEEDVRYYLNGMLIEIKKDHLYAVAADGHRLAQNSIPINVDDQRSFRVIVPRKGVLELQRVLGEGDEEIQIIISANHIRATTPYLSLTSKLLDGRFPDYDRIIPKGEGKVLVGRRSVLKEAFLRAAALFSEKLRGVQLLLSQNSLKILAITPEQDEVEEDLEVQYEGPEFEIGFNVKYLIDFLNIIPTEEVKFTFKDENSSARVEGVGGDGAVYVIMPMRI